MGRKESRPCKLVKLNTALDIVQQHLSSLAYIKLEWSLSLSAAACLPRNKPLVWVGLKDTKENHEAFQAMGEVLKELDCPESIRAIQQKFSITSHTQGIRLDMGPSPIYCLYIDHTTGGEKKRIQAFLWKEGEVVRTADYSNHRISKTNDIDDPLAHIHPDLKAFFALCCENELLKTKSVYGYQHRDGNIQEVYLTYFWHPTLRLIAEALPSNFRKRLLTSPYVDLPFRHIGFANNLAQEPQLTIYFSAPYRGKWPYSFEELQEVVTASSRMLVSELIAFGGIKV